MIICLLIIALFGSMAVAIPVDTVMIAGNSVTVSWQPNTENDLTGYRLYFSHDASHDTKNFVLNVKTVDAHASNFSVGTWSVAVSAYDSAGNESTSSAPVWFKITSTATVVEKNIGDEFWIDARIHNGSDVHLISGNLLIPNIVQVLSDTGKLPISEIGDFLQNPDLIIDFQDSDTSKILVGYTTTLSNFTGFGDGLLWGLKFKAVRAGIGMIAWGPASQVSNLTGFIPANFENLQLKIAGLSNINVIYLIIRK